MTDHTPWAVMGSHNSNPNAELATAAADEMQINDSCTQLSFGSDDDDEYNDKRTILPPPPNYNDRGRPMSYLARPPLPSPILNILPSQR